jgi:LCP family protein required for cell wall assembly
MRQQRGSLDNFKSVEGFHATKQPTIQTEKSQRHLGRRPRRDPNGVIDLSLPPAPPSKFGRFKRNKKNRSRKQKILHSFAGVMLFVMVVGGFLFGKGYLKLHQIFKGGAQGAAALQDNVDPTKLNGEGDGRVNILLLGKGGDGHEAPDLTDTILIASIDPVQKKAALLSVPRDLWVTTSKGSSKINAVYANAKYSAQDRGKSDKEAEDAGLSAIQSIVSEKMGIPIHYHVIVDFSGFKQAIDTVGGIDINVGEDNTVYEVLYDHQAGRQYVLDVKKGWQHFDGTRALFYSRSRHTSNRGDFDRTERQRLVMIALKDKILSLGTFANPVKVSQLMDAFGNHVQANLTIGEVMRIYEIGKSINSQDIASVGLADPPNNYVTTDNINGQSIVRPRAGLTDFSEIQNYVRNALRDGYLTKENATVAVYNGTTTPGLASKKSIELKSFGYTIGTVANAPTANYTKTVVVDLTNGQKKYTRNYLEKRFGVTAVTTIPDAGIPAGSNDFVIIIGQDAVGN